MTTPDPADLRLVAALAELGRASLFDVAARAGIAPEEAAIRMLRLNAAGLRLVLGIEGDQAALHAWVANRRPHPAPPTPPAQPQWGSASAAPVGWGVPTSSGWVRPGPGTPQGPLAPQGPPAPQPPPAPAPVGTRLGGVGPHGAPVWVTPVEVIDTADALVAAAGHTLATGSRASVVHTEVTAGAAGYPTAPDAGLVLVLADGREVSHSSATLTSRPPFRGGLAAGETVVGNTVFELDAQATIVGVRWRSVPHAVPLQWRL